ncbi:sodium:solute symporter [candidate division KSB1 bacterium]|nr:sodium:solute symporter [candidate division KSB1 bacterium]
MNLIDYLIIVIYLFSLVFCGFYFRKRAGKNINDYFLGGRKIPWWILGASGMASNLDMTGTMLITSFFYIIGVKGFLIEIRGGVVLVMAFMMVFVGKWHSRSGVMTVAEWMEFRFGSGTQGEAARLLSAISILIGTIGVIGYFFVGAGKFLSTFLPFSPTVCALVMISVALFYTTLSGLLGVVYTDLLQAVLIGFAALFISIRAFTSLNYDTIQAITPKGWSDIVPSWRITLPAYYKMYNLFGISVIFFFLKTIIEGLGAPGGYMAQRYFAAKNDRDSGLLSALWIFLLSFRWPFIIGIAILGLNLGAKVPEPEKVLPTVLIHTVPIGLRGLIFAALIAAAMSTFDSTINAAASYLVNDIYSKYIRKDATGKQLVRAGYFSSVLIVVLGVSIGVVTPSINSIWGWITMSLVAGMIMPNFLRWYWWRFNGYGFAYGTGIGIIAAVVQKLAFSDLHEWLAFVAVGSVSLIGMIVTTFLTDPTEKKVLVNFYIKTRPIGFWGKVSKNLNPNIVRLVKRENKRDIIALLFAIPWQISIFLTPVFFVIHNWINFWVFMSIAIMTSTGLYFSWFKFLIKENPINKN